MTIDNQRIQDLAGRVKDDRRFCADEHHHALADGVLALLAEIEKLEAAKHTVECRFEVSADTLSTIRGCLREAESDIDQLKAENEALKSELRKEKSNG